MTSIAAGLFFLSVTYLVSYSLWYVLMGQGDEMDRCRWCVDGVFDYRSDPNAIERYATCQHCAGSGESLDFEGRWDAVTWITCPRCNDKPGDFDDPRYGCNRCHGGGKVRDSDKGHIDTTLDRE
jgi:DnaJ-class molecular chaperone